jgi:dihydrofolate reductase
MSEKRPFISFVVALDQDRVIGLDGALPWRLPDDMKRFREITMGHPVLMGRKTYESLPPRFRPLPGRKNIILTRQTDYDAPGCVVVNSAAEALQVVAEEEELMIIGGAQLYEAFFDVADRLYVTFVEGRHEGDAFFPTINPDQWREIAREEHPADERHAMPFSFVVLDRV